MRENHYVKALFSPREGHLSLRWIKRIICDKAKGLRITSERYIGEMGVRCLSTINRAQDSAATVSYRSSSRPILLHAATYIGQLSDPYRFVAPPSQEAQNQEQRRAPSSCPKRDREKGHEERSEALSGGRTTGRGRERSAEQHSPHR